MGPKDYGAVFDTISVCLSKGLGCPIGSVLIGDSVIMEKAIRIRKMLGGGMRQVGVLAAAGLYALDHHRKRLSEDHQKANEIGQILQNKSYVAKLQPIETNILIFELASHINADQFVLNLEKKGVLISNMGGGKLRMVTHLDYNLEMHEKLIETLESIS